MKTTILARVFLSAGALLGGLLIVFISLTAANPVLSAEMNESERQLYFGQAILPDHVLYPVLMIADRAKLETVSGEDEIYTRVAYGIRRQEAAESLLEKNKEALAFTTITKSQKYLHQAGNQLIAEKKPGELALYVEKALVSQNQLLDQLKPSFSSSYQAELDVIKESNILFIMQLDSYRK